MFFVQLSDILRLTHLSLTSFSQFTLSRFVHVFCSLDFRASFFGATPQGGGVCVCARVCACKMYVSAILIYPQCVYKGKSIRSTHAVCRQIALFNYKQLWIIKGKVLFTVYHRRWRRQAFLATVDYYLSLLSILCLSDNKSWAWKRLISARVCVGWPLFRVFLSRFCVRVPIGGGMFKRKRAFKFIKSNSLLRLHLCACVKIE